MVNWLDVSSSFFPFSSILVCWLLISRMVEFFLFWCWWNWICLFSLRSIRIRNNKLRCVLLCIIYFIASLLCMVVCFTYQGEFYGLLFVLCLILLPLLGWTWVTLMLLWVCIRKHALLRLKLHCWFSKHGW